MAKRTTTIPAGADTGAAGQGAPRGGPGRPGAGPPLAPTQDVPGASPGAATGRQGAGAPAGAGGRQGAAQGPARGDGRAGPPGDDHRDARGTHSGEQARAYPCHPPGASGRQGLAQTLCGRHVPPGPASPFVRAWLYSLVYECYNRAPCAQKEHIKAHVRRLGACLLHGIDGDDRYGGPAPPGVTEDTRVVREEAITATVDALLTALEEGLWASAK